MDSDPEWTMDPDYAEILRRLEEVRSGNAEMISGEEFMREIGAYLGKAGLSREVRSARPHPDDFETAAEYEAAWDQEIERRIQAYDRGKIEAIDAGVVMAALRKRFGIPGDR